MEEARKGLPYFFYSNWNHPFWSNRG